MKDDQLVVAVAQPGLIPQNHKEALALVEQLFILSARAELLVLPELALCGYGDEARIQRLAAGRTSDFVNDLQALTKRYGIALIAGMAERDGDRLFNCALAIGASGEILATYRKVNLWGPYENGLFVAGEPSVLFFIHDFKIGLIICHDLDYPETARDLALRGADIIVVLSATNAEYKIIADMVAPTRAYENSVYLVYADAVGTDGPFQFLGHSRILSPAGGMLASLDASQGAVATACVTRQTLSETRNRHPYLSRRRPELYLL